jgi:hypothetical protein
LWDDLCVAGKEVFARLTVRASSAHRQFTGRISRCLGIEPVDAIEIGKIAGLTEAADAKRIDGIASDAPEPGECGRTPIVHRYDAGIARQSLQQAVYMRCDAIFSLPASAAGFAPALV